MHHGCILFSSKLDDLQNALKVNTDKLKGKGSSSARSRVTNIIDYLEKKMDVEQFINHLEGYVLKHSDEAIIKNLTKSEREGIAKLSASKYENWDWNYGRSLEYNFRNKARFIAGGVEVVMNVDAGIIKDCRIFGDFFNTRPVCELEEMLIGQKHEFSCITRLLEQIQVDKYIVGISNEEMLSVLF